jgi:hypothetical protein
LLSSHTPTVKVNGSSPAGGKIKKILASVTYKEPVIEHEALWLSPSAVHDGKRNSRKETDFAESRHYG